MKRSLEVLNAGKALAIFPEGTRVKDRTLKRAKPGIGFLVHKTGAPVVPAYIEGSFDAQPRGIKTLKRYPVKVHIGKPVDFKSWCEKPGNTELYQGISDEIMRRIASFKPL